VRGDSVEGWHDTVTVSCCTTARDGRGASPRTVRRRRRLHTPSRSFHDESEHGAGARRSTDRLGGAHGCHEAYAVTAAQATSGDGVELPSGDTAGRQSRGSLAGHTRGMHVTQRPALRRPLGGPRARVTMAPNNTLEPRHSAVLRGRLWRLGGLLGRVNWYVGVVFLYVRSHWSAWARAAARSGTLRSRFVDVNALRIGWKRVQYCRNPGEPPLGVCYDAATGLALILWLELGSGMGGGGALG
jgi:hypothetical protein